MAISVLRTLKRWVRPIALPVLVLLYERGPLARLLRNYDYPARYVRECMRFTRDMARYSRMRGAEPIRLVDLEPVFFQRNAPVKVDPHYFHAHNWALNRIVELAPELHVDVASSYAFAGMLGAITRVRYVELNPPGLEAKNVEVVRGNLLDLPFPDGGLGSVSCLHAAEHVGLGRYGDALDPLGTRKAAAELARVLAPGGSLLFAVPVGRPRLRFNGQRIHESGQILDYFADLELVQFCGVDDGGAFLENVAPDTLDDRFCACGCFWFRKPIPAEVRSSGLRVET